MNLVQKFIESESRKAFVNYRDRFEIWLTEVDVDQNGEKDKQQILADFDKIRDGLLTVVSGLTDLSELAAEYYRKYGKELVEGTAPTPDATQESK